MYFGFIFAVQNLYGLVNVGLGYTCLSAGLDEIILLTKQEVTIIVKDYELIVPILVIVFLIIWPAGFITAILGSHAEEHPAMA